MLTVTFSNVIVGIGCFILRTLTGALWYHVQKYAKTILINVIRQFVCATLHNA